jgi:hypothetical protein
MATQQRPRSRSDHRSASRPAAANRSRPSRSHEGKSPNEGEGSRSAARDYNQRTERFIHEGRVDKSAEEAKHAVDGEERDALLEAERIGRAPRRT